MTASRPDAPPQHEKPIDLLEIARTVSRALSPVVSVPPNVETFTDQLRGHVHSLLVAIDEDGTNPQRLQLFTDAYRLMELTRTPAATPFYAWERMRGLAEVAQRLAGLYELRNPTARPAPTSEPLPPREPASRRPMRRPPRGRMFVAPASTGERPTQVLLEQAEAPAESGHQKSSPRLAACEGQGDREPS
ncbi:hypothetical protein J7W19_29355 [Streptomyces mobaraensis NBRC 13819 = DSM 40847]|uniref:Uncharacterized protein n=1 Tax=Streptomyces mobaraensis (strain ATCC 29032 / DSM 40847 / JCM 4168 / NBRC 13819 / NCIMB 11159 / IPCR 16-22) TaxID=1223523 RepID=M3AB35_STRM1|nr:DUF6415 family natural product biosynthesis protein [Streptomyces mobaraensis]EMF02404.1 hypothetical protein H340_01119 [Streptomyces mobaraensis NBRC 13819 = DSM 40847]QTT76946.1 hypothetical protein J7W19_29355 [Streptomyces mobaraensis NBRC 13819 = DSM 40847]